MGVWGRKGVKGPRLARAYTPTAASRPVCRRPGGRPVRRRGLQPGSSLFFSLDKSPPYPYHQCQGGPGIREAGNTGDRESGRGEESGRPGKCGAADVQGFARRYPPRPLHRGAERGREDVGVAAERTLRKLQARSSVGERYLDTVEVGGSKPPVPTIFSKAAAGSASRACAEGGLLFVVLW